MDSHEEIEVTTDHHNHHHQQHQHLTRLQSNERNVVGLDESNNSSNVNFNLDDVKYRSVEFGVVGMEENDESHFTDNKYQNNETQNTNGLEEQKVGTKQEDEHEHEHEEKDCNVYDSSNNNSSIQFPMNKLYGRDQELARFQQLYHRMITANESQAVFLSAYSGSGKTRLVYEAVKQFTNTNNDTNNTNKLLFLYGKHEEQEREAPVPYKAMSEAFRNYYKQLVVSFRNKNNNHDNEMMEFTTTIRTQLEQVVGNDESIIAALCEIIPQQLIREEDDCSTSTSLSNKTTAATTTNESVTKYRLHVAFRAFLNALCQAQKSHLIIYIDDLQWVDHGTLELLQAILVQNNNNINNNNNNESAIYTNRPTSEQSPQRQKQYPIFFIGAYRSNEVDPRTHPLATLISELDVKDSNNNTIAAVSGEHVLLSQDHHQQQQQQKHRRYPAVERIELTDLSKDTVGSFIADTLNLEREQVRPLTEAIYRKTLGNIFFTRQALEQLVRRNALYYDMVVFSWQWKGVTQQKLEQELSNDIVEMVKSKIACLSQDLQRALAVAAHTRSSLDIDTYHVLLNAYEERVNRSRGANYYSTRESFKALLDRAVAEGLLEVTTLETESEHNQLEYTFAHDRIREASRSFVAGDELNTVLYTIGNVLANRGSDDVVGEEWMLFVAIHHLNAVPAATFHTDGNARLKLARLNLAAVKLSMGKAAYDDAAKYAEKGIQVLPKDRWDSCFVLSHDLYALAAESSRLIGDIQRMERYCTACLTVERDLPLDANYQVYYTLALGLLYGSNRYGEAKKILLNLLKRLDCHFPQSATMTASRTMYQIITLVVTKRRRSREEVDKMQMMTDPKKLKAMKLLDKLFDICYLMKDEVLLPLVIFRALDYTLKYGLSIHSPRLVASVCVLLTGHLNDLKGGGMYAEYALQMMRKVNHKPVECGTLFITCCFARHWVVPVADCIEPLRRAVTIGINSGDAENACWSAFFVAFFSFQAGKPLPTVDAELKRYVPRMEELGQKMIADISKSFWFAVLGLMGMPRDHAKVTLSEAEFENVTLYESVQGYARMEHSRMGDHQRCADKVLKHSDSFLKSVPGTSAACVVMVTSAVTCIESARRTGKSKYLRQAKIIRKHVNGWARQRNPYMNHWKVFLDAEFAALTRQDKTAVKKFQWLLIVLWKVGIFTMPLLPTNGGDFLR